MSVTSKAFEDWWAKKKKSARHSGSPAHKSDAHLRKWHEEQASLHEEFEKLSDDDKELVHAWNQVDVLGLASKKKNVPVHGEAACRIFLLIRRAQKLAEGLYFFSAANVDKTVSVAEELATVSATLSKMVSAYGKDG